MFNKEICKPGYGQRHYHVTGSSALIPAGSGRYDFDDRILKKGAERDAFRLRPQL